LEDRIKRLQGGSVWQEGENRRRISNLGKRQHCIKRKGVADVKEGIDAEDSVWVEIRDCKNSKILVGCLYCDPRGKEEEEEFRRTCAKRRVLILGNEDVLLGRWKEWITSGISNQTIIIHYLHQRFGWWGEESAFQICR